LGEKNIQSSKFFQSSSNMLLKNTLVLSLVAILTTFLPLNIALAQQGFVTYQDLQGRFTIKHPPDWQAHPAENRFAAAEVEFTKSNSSGLLASLDVRTIPGLNGEMIKHFGMERFMQEATNTLQVDVPNFSLEQGIECHTYTLSGSQACSIIYSRTLDQISKLELAVMQIAAVKGNSGYMLSYTSRVEEFDRYLPVVSQMVPSFQILESLADGEEEKSGLQVHNVPN
jgi:eukaryotic-like serine/threonine-protein kinase